MLILWSFDAKIEVEIEIRLIAGGPSFHRPTSGGRAGWGEVMGAPVAPEVERVDSL